MSEIREANQVDSEQVVKDSKAKATKHIHTHTNCCQRRDLLPSQLKGCRGIVGNYIPH